MKYSPENKEAMMKYEEVVTKHYSMKMIQQMKKMKNRTNEVQRRLQLGWLQLASCI